MQSRERRILPSIGYSCREVDSPSWLHPGRHPLTRLDTRPAEGRIGLHVRRRQRRFREGKPRVWRRGGGYYIATTSRRETNNQNLRRCSSDVVEDRIAAMLRHAYLCGACGATQNNRKSGTADTETSAMITLMARHWGKRYVVCQLRFEEWRSFIRCGGFRIHTHHGTKDRWWQPVLRRCQLGRPMASLRLLVVYGSGLPS